MTLKTPPPSDSHPVDVQLVAYATLDKDKLSDVASSYLKGADLHVAETPRY